MSTSSRTEPTPEQLKALSHPVRIAILGKLRLDGAHTASQLADFLGRNSGATSYHLRQLALHGFIEDAAELGNARDRYWRAKHKSTSIEQGTGNPELEGGFLRSVHSTLATYRNAAFEEYPQLSDQWRKAHISDDWYAPMTPAQAIELGTRLRQVVKGYLAEIDSQDTEDTKLYFVQIFGFTRAVSMTPEASNSPETQDQ